MPAFPSREQVLQVFEAHPEKIFRLRELVQALGLASSQARDLKSALKELSRSRKILVLRKSHFALARRAGADSSARGLTKHGPLARTRGQGNIVTGRLIGHRDGYGFVVPDEQAGGEASGQTKGQDIFIPPHAMKDAMHGDRVEVQVFRAKPERPQNPGRFAPRQQKPSRPARPPRLEGAILRVLRREQRTVVGEFHCAARHNFVQPFDSRIGREIIIPRGEERVRESSSSARDRQFGGESEGHARRARREGASGLDGLIVDVEITSFPGRTSLAHGRVIEVLGERDDFGVDVEIMIRKFHLPHRFPAEALAAASESPREVTQAELEGRRDFRSLPIVTIDGETAKDFDDAVYVERLPGGRYSLQVHIADVAHYVRPGTAIDGEARLRGTSVYFPDRAVPMLPLDLSNGICSLNP
ncbi:MAG: RNB domain-containing ribonuclease, partial [Terriglobia bacterium]